MPNFIFSDAQLRSRGKVDPGSIYIDEIIAAFRELVG